MREEGGRETREEEGGETREVLGLLPTICWGGC